MNLTRLRRGLQDVAHDFTSGADIFDIELTS